MLREYPKIYGPYKRETSGPNKNQLIIGEWYRPEFGYLQDFSWIFTEKVDGTNVRVHWDGHRVRFNGRTHVSQMPLTLLSVLQEMFPEELFEQKFGQDEATLYGEGYGAGIQKGGIYRSDPSFVLFDVQVGDWWLLREDVEDVAKAFDLLTVPVVLTGTLHEGIMQVREGFLSGWGHTQPEGLVGVTEVGLLDRSGKRIMIKIKAADFKT